MKKNNSKVNPMALKALEHLKRVKEEEDRIKAIQEEEERLIKEAEDKKAAEEKAIEDEKLRKKTVKQAKIAAQKEEGIYKTKNQKLKEKNMEEQRSRLISTSNVSNNIPVNNISVSNNIPVNNSEKNDLNCTNFRAPVICVMGHVDTGKTKLMDKLRNTNVQEGEVAGITQQIGATFIPKTNIFIKTHISIPGFLMIDTPGHEAFLNLRKRGTSLSDIVILVIDLVHGIEQQTIESIQLLKETNTKFIIALNKIDRLYQWNTIENRSIHDALENNELCIHEFNNRLYTIQGQLKEQGINSELYWKNDSINDTVSICPISAITGEGISNLLELLVTISETQIAEQITVSDKLKCIVMEKTVMDGVGVTVDVLLISGTLNKGDDILIRSSNGPIKTQIRNLLTPPPQCESRVATTFNNNSSLTGTIGFKLVAANLENILIGSYIMFDNNLDIKTNIEENVEKCIKTTFPLQNNGVLVYASSEGSLEALMHHLQVVCSPPVCVSTVYIGKVTKKHISKMIISNKTDYKEINTVLAFDVNIDDDAQELATKNNITILSDGTIYRLFSQYEKFRIDSENERKNVHRHLIVYPCIITILKDKIFRKKGPFIFGVKVIEGNLHINTPLIIPGKKLIIGKVISIQNEGNNIEIANKGLEVCIKIEDESQNNYMYGRQFDYTDTFISHVTRVSIDTMKTHFKNEITTEDGKLNNTGKLLKLLKEQLN